MSHVLRTRTQHTQSSARASARHRPVLSQLGPCPRPFFLFVRCSNATWIISTPTLPSRDHRPVLCVDTIRVEVLAIAQRLHSLKFTSYSDPQAHRTLFLWIRPATVRQELTFFWERKARTPHKITFLVKSSESLKIGVSLRAPQRWSFDCKDNDDVLIAPRGGVYVRGEQ